MKKIKVPSNFAGWIDKKYGIGWVVNIWRKDQRSGVIPYDSQHCRND